MLARRRLEMGCRHAARQLDPQVHHRALGAGEEIVECRGADDVCHLVRIADRRRDAAGKHERSNSNGVVERRFHMQMRVDEARHGDAPASLDRPFAAIRGIGADDRIAADRDVGRRERPRDEIEEADVLDDEVGGQTAAALCDACGEGRRVKLLFHSGQKSPPAPGPPVCRRASPLRPILCPRDAAREGKRGLHAIL